MFKCFDVQTFKCSNIRMFKMFTCIAIAQVGVCEATGDSELGSAALCLCLQPPIKEHRYLGGFYFLDYFHILSYFMGLFFRILFYILLGYAALCFCLLQPPIKKHCYFERQNFFLGRDILSSYICRSMVLIWTT